MSLEKPTIETNPVDPKTEPGSEPEVENLTNVKIDREQQETARLEEGIKLYQRDRSNVELRGELLEQIRGRAVFLSREDFVKRAGEEGREEPIPMSEFFGYGGVGSRPIINSEALPVEHQPYIVTHESVEVLETGPWINEANEWKEEHGTDHPQLAIQSHVEATYAEYRHARDEGKLGWHHLFMTSWAEKLALEYGDKLPGLIDLIQGEVSQRQRIFAEVTSEKVVNNTIDLSLETD